ncbi:hypothetical protein GPECTOR_10g833 [Gonium pectorale]|uniref:Cyclic nucleotide-binding domain-containing protein n=1 Tax=Gonium pectorale TaxID=33097 RepID=A0A150GR29_GONPE|nr:hypothetical protein GPECTOR_10g833 [Gonium pectorale]|eukprot:KXZ52202.1 hypothetical protein GPECTOR_10g833 [Gonium pectorale]
MQAATSGFDPADPHGGSGGTAHFASNADTPNFFQSTKFFACLDVDEARELFRSTKRVSLAPHEVLFRSGDPSDSGIFIVLHGTLGVFLEEPDRSAPPIHANTLRSGESVGDLDVVDGAARTVSCMALEGLARLWRVAHFVLADFLQLQLYRPKKAGEGGLGDGVPQGVPPLPRRTLSNLFGHERGTQTEEAQSVPPSPPPSPPAEVEGRRRAAAAAAASGGSGSAADGGAPADELPRPAVAFTSNDSGSRSGRGVAKASAAAAATAAEAQPGELWDCEAAAPSGATPHPSFVEPAPAAASTPTFNELLASAAASARTRGAGGPNHGPLRHDPTKDGSTKAAMAAAALLANSLRRSFVLGARACLAAGWDVIDVEEAAFGDIVWSTLSDPRSGVGIQLPLAAGGMLQDMDWACGCFYLLLDGHLLAERPACPPGGGAPEESAAGAAGAGPGPGAAPLLESGLISPGSLISCAAFLSSTAARCKVVALEPCRLVAFSWQALLAEQPDLLLRLLVAASAALGPVIRRFISLGLNRVWLESGDVAYRQGDFAECLYVVISGRLRLLHETLHPVTHARQLHLEEEVGRGEAVGAVWAITGGHHDTTALCVRDSELVRMSRSAFRVISADSPLALSKLFSNIARRLVAAWDSRVRSDRTSGSSNGPANASAAVASAGGMGSPSLAFRVMGGAPGGGGQQLPNPARLGLTPLKSAAQLAGGGSVVRGPRPSGRRGEIVTIAILPAGVLPDSVAATAMASALSGSPTDVAAAAAALAAAEAASMGGGAASAGRGTGPAGSSSRLYSGGSSTGPQWRPPPGMGKQAAALATLTAIKRLSGALKA